MMQSKFIDWLTNIGNMPRFTLLAGIFIGGLVAISVYAALAIRPVGGPQQQIIVPTGMSRVELARELKNNKLIRSSTAFIVATLLERASIKAGTFTVDPESSLVSIVKNLTQAHDAMIRITIPEGWRREQIANLLNQEKFNGSEFLAATMEDEGYLFPDTYFFRQDASGAQIAERLKATFTTKTAELVITRDIVTLASIVEREAVRDEERSLIAGIYTNRLRLGMKLDADPTVQYGRDTNTLLAGTGLARYWEGITLANYTNVISPYNTYLNPGLPPGPIANPGLKSLQAAANPATTNALYFFHLKNGDIITSRTLAEHNSNKQKYIRQR